MDPPRMQFSTDSAKGVMPLAIATAHNVYATLCQSMPSRHKLTAPTMVQANANNPPKIATIIKGTIPIMVKMRITAST